MNEIGYSFDGLLVKPVDEGAPELSAPPQGTDSNEYLCGNSGHESYGSHTAGRDQDRSRVDEHIPAQGCSRYVS